MSEGLRLLWVDFGSEEYRRTVELRQQILRTPLGLKFSPEELAGERKDHHLAAIEDGQLLACLVLSPGENGIMKMRQVAVCEEMQGKGIGKQMIAASEEFCRMHEIKKIILNARQKVVPFYAKLGYKVTSDLFVEVTIPHLKMEKTIYGNTNKDQQQADGDFQNQKQ